MARFGLIKVFEGVSETEKSVCVVTSTLDFISRTIWNFLATIRLQLIIALRFIDFGATVIVLAISNLVF